MSQVLAAVGAEGFSAFVSLFRAEEGRLGVVVTLLAVLELLKEALLEVVQAEPYGPIHLRAAGSHGA
jgi:segregation and condensation protein A